MRLVIIGLITSVFILSSGCHLYEHNNPIDPNNPNVKNGKALFTIISYSLTDDLPGIFTGDMILAISIKNTGNGIAEGELTGYLSSKDSVSYNPIHYDKCSFEHKGTAATIIPGEVLDGSFGIKVSTKKERPFQIGFTLVVQDANKNSYIDSLQVTVPK